MPTNIELASVRIQRAIDKGTAVRLPDNSAWPEGSRVRYRFASTLPWNEGTVVAWLRVDGDTGPAIAWDGQRGADGNWGWFGHNGAGLQGVTS